MCLVRAYANRLNPCFRNSWLSLSLPLRVQVLSLLAAAKTVFTAGSVCCYSYCCAFARGTDSRFCSL